MPSASRISRSLAPGCRHQLRSKARMRISRSDSAAIRPSLTPRLRLHRRQPLCHSAADNVRSPFVATYDCLTFLTDYGVEDGFVAACHGVAARIVPAIRLIDITHLVPPGDV